MTQGVRELLSRGLALVTCFGLGVSLLVLPRLRQTERINGEIQELQTKIHGLSDQTDEIDLLANLIIALTKRSDGLQGIPTAPENAELIRRLSVPARRAQLSRA